MKFSKALKNTIWIRFIQKPPAPRK